MPKQTSDVSGNPFTIQYSAINQKWTIAKGVEVFGDVAGIYSTYAGSKLVNEGDVSGGMTGGVLFDMAGATGTYSIVNKAKGEISGLYAVYVNDFRGSFDFQNDGAIDGGIFGVYAVGSSAVSVDNEGSIVADQYGLFLAGAYTGASGPDVDNYGKVEGGVIAVYLSGPGGLEAKLVNHEGATITSPQVALYSLYKSNITNEGKIEGTIVTSGYDDKITNKKTIKGDVQLGDGLDTFKQKGDKAKAGLIDTQDGNDLVVLGTKADKLLFDSTLNAATNVDTIKKFASGKDMIYLDEDVFSTIMPGTLSSAAFHEGTSAADADDRIIYDKASGALYYDPDGLGGVAQTQFAKLDGGPKLKSSDFTIGDYSIAI